MNRTRVKHLFEKAKKEKRDPLLPEAFEVLRAYGIPVAGYELIHEKKELMSAIEKMGKPVALKVISPEVSHKSDQGGVLLSIHSLSGGRKGL